MKVTDEMVRAFTAAVWVNPHSLIELDEDERRAGIQAVLDLIMPHPQQDSKVIVDGDQVIVIFDRERPHLAAMLRNGLPYTFSYDAIPIPAERAE